MGVEHFSEKHAFENVLRNWQCDSGEPFRISRLPWFAILFSRNVFPPEIKENSSLGPYRDLFKKIRDTKGTFHAKMGTIKDRNGTDLTEAEDIKKRWQEYTEELNKKRSS